MKVTKEHWTELQDKISFVERLNFGFAGLKMKYTTVSKIDYDVFAVDDRLYEAVVVQYIGGGKAVANCAGNSMSAIFRAIGKLLDGGYYDELAWYNAAKAAQKITPTEIEVVEE